MTTHTCANHFFAICFTIVSIFVCYRFCRCRMRGTPSLSGFGNFNMEVTGSTQPRQLIVSWSKSDSSMTAMINSLLGLDLSSQPFAKMFSGPSAIGVTISTADMAFLPVPFSFYPLNTTNTVTRGLSFLVVLQLPKSCGHDPFCNFFRLILGNTKITFRVYDIKRRSMTIAYRIPGTISFAGFKLYNVEAGMRIGVTVPTFGLTNVEMDVSTGDGKTLHFIGSLTIDPFQNADAKMWMIGMWQRAFSIPFLSIGNILARIRTHISCPLCISALSLGGELWIGTNCAGSGASKCIKGAAYIAIDYLDPDEEWAYATVNQASYSKLIRALGINVPGLEMLDTSSYRNCEFSYSKIDRVLPSGVAPHGKTIRAGMVFKGDVTLLWFYNVHFDMTVYTTLGYVTYVKAFITATRVDFGLVKFTSASDRSKGPVFYLEAGLFPPKYGFTMDGELSVPALSIRRRVIATIDRDGFKGTLTTAIFGFTSTYQLTATFVNVLNPTSLRAFRITGSFATDLAIGSKVVDTLTDVRDKTSRVLTSAVDTLALAEQELKDLLTKEQYYETIYKQKKQAFDAADRVLSGAQDVVNRLCSIRTCYKFSVKRPDVGTCTRCQSWWIAGTSCFTFICTLGFKTVWLPDLICEGKNKVCEGLRKTAFEALAKARSGLSKAQSALRTATDNFRKATKLVLDQRPLTNAAKLAESSARFVFNGVASVVKHLQFTIHRISFSTYLRSITGGQVSAWVDITVSGTRQTISLTINLKNPAETAKLLARKFFPQVFANFDKMFG